MDTDKAIKPLHDRVVIKPLPVDSVTKSGIIIPDTAQGKPDKGEILYCGKGINGIPLEVKVGDIVLYGKHAGQPISIEEGDCLIMREADIMMVI